eukprot:997073-Pyramimonas_sp.AAC.1
MRCWLVEASPGMNGLQLPGKIGPSSQRETGRFELAAKTVSGRGQRRAARDYVKEFRDSVEDMASLGRLHQALQPTPQPDF